MLLIDLFEAPVPIVRKAPPKDWAEKYLTSKKDAKLIGGGAWGNVYSIPGDVETAAKVTDISVNWKKDGYYNFINKVRAYKNETHNPYLPQIYDITRYHSVPEKYSSGKPYLVVSLEKLYDINDFSYDQQKLLLQKICGADANDAEFEANFKYESDHWGGDLPSIIATLLKKTITKQKYTLKITDKDLLKALSIVRNLHHKGFAIDLQTCNYLCRRTPYGPQLVLTDPLSYWEPNYVKIKMIK